MIAAPIIIFWLVSFLPYRSSPVTSLSVVLAPNGIFSHSLIDSSNVIAFFWSFASSPFSRPIALNGGGASEEIKCRIFVDFFALDSVIFHEITIVFEIGGRSPHSVIRRERGICGIKATANGRIPIKPKLRICLRCTRTYAIHTLGIARCEDDGRRPCGYPRHVGITVVPPRLTSVFI